MHGLQAALSGRGAEVFAARPVTDGQRDLALVRRVLLALAVEGEHQQGGGGERVDEAVQEQRCAQREPQRFRLRAFHQPPQRLWDAERIRAGEERIQRIVELRDRGAQPGAEEVAHAAKAVPQRREAHAAHPSPARAAPDPQPGGGEDRQGTFVSEQELREIGPPARAFQRPQDLTRSVHRLEREHHVRDRSMARGEQAGAARREPASDRRRGQGGRKVAESSPGMGEQLLQPIAAQACAHLHGAGGQIDLEGTRETLCVEDDTAPQRDGAAGAPRAAAHRHDRDLPLRSEADHGRHLVDVLGPRHHVGWMRNDPRFGPEQRARRAVPRGRPEIDRLAGRRNPERGDLAPQCLASSGRARQRARHALHRRP